jgi:putative heme utilization carrier protein HutX
VPDLLPEGAARSVPSAWFAEIWGDLVDWGPVTFIVHTEDGVFETKAPLPLGGETRRYFNIHGESPLGDLRIGRCAAIYFGDRPFFGRRSCSLQFVNIDGGAMFKVFVGRDEIANCSQTSLLASSGCATPRRLPPDGWWQGWSHPPRKSSRSIAVRAAIRQIAASTAPGSGSLPESPSQLVSHPL